MATTIYRKIGFDVTGAMASINKLNGAIKTLSNTMKNVGGGKAGGAFSDLTRSAQQAGPVLMGFSNGSKAAINSLDQLVKQAQHAAAGMKGLAPGIEAAGKAGGMFANMGQKIAGVMGQLGGARAILTGIWGSFSKAAEAAREFGLRIAEVQTIAGELNMTNADLSARVLELSSSLGLAAGDVAKGLYQTLSNQVVEAGDSFAFLEEAARLAKVAVSTTGESIDAMSSVMNSYNLSASEMTRVSGTLFKAVDLGRFTLKDLSDILGRVTPIASQAGIAWEEVAAAIATMTQQGVRADTAVTQLRAVITKLIKPTKELQAVYQRWGVQDGPTAIATFGGLKGVLQKLQQETKGSTSELSGLFNEVRGLAGALALNVENGNKFADSLDQITKAGQGIDGVFAKFNADPAQQLTIATETLNNAWIQFGQQVMPIVIGFKTALAGILGILGQIAGVGINAVKEVFGDSQAFERSAYEKRQKAQGERASQLGLQKRENLFDNPEAKAKLQEFNRLLADGMRQYRQEAQGIIRTQDEMTRSFIAFSQTTVARFTSAIGEIKKRLQELPGVIKGVDKALAGAKAEVGAEELSQKLENAEGDAAQRIKILREEAEKQYSDFRKRSHEKIMNEEQAAELDAQRKRAIEAQKALEAEARAQGQSGKTGDVGQANQRALELTKEGVKIQEDLKKALIEQGNLLSKAADELIRKQKELVSLDKERVSLAKELLKAMNAGDPNAVKAAKDKLDENAQKQAKAGALSDTAKAAMDSVKGVGFGDAIEKSLTEALPRATQNLQIWMDEQQDKLQDLQASIEITPNINMGQLMQTLREAGFEINNRDPQGSITRAQNEMIQKESAKNEALNQLDATTSNLKDANKELSMQSGEVDKAIDQMLGNLNTDSVAALDSLKNLMKEYVAGNITMSPETIEKVKGELQKAQEGLWDMAEKNVLEAAETLADRLAKAIDAAGKNATATQNASAAQEAAAPGRQFNDIMRAATGDTNLQTKAMEEVSNQLVTAKDRAAAYERMMADITTETNTAATSTANIGTAATTAAGQFGGISSALDGIIQKAEAAAQRVASIASGASGAAAPHFGGHYFARGGLGRLAPRGTDTIPAMLQRGEFVVNKKATGKYFSQLSAMNGGLRPLYRKEGGSVTNVGDVNVTVNGGETSRQTVRAIARELRHELKRGTIRFN